MRRPVRLKNDSTRLVIEGMGDGSGTTHAGFSEFFSANTVTAIATVT